MTRNFEMYAGDSKSLAFAVTDTSGVAVTVTGATCAFVVATAPGATALLSKSTAGGTITAAGSTVTVTLVEADTAALSGTYWYELEITDATGYISSNQGFVIVQPTLIA